MLLQMGSQQVSRSNAKLTVARMEVRKVSRHLTACVLPENSYLWHVCSCSMCSECVRCVMVKEGEVKKLFFCLLFVFILNKM